MAVTYVAHATDGATPQVRDQNIVMVVGAARAIALDGRVGVIRTGFETRHAAVYVRRAGDSFEVTGRGSFIEKVRQLLEEHG